VLLCLSGRANHVVDVDAGLKSFLDRAAVAYFAKDDVAMQLDLHVLTALDALGNSNAQAGGGNVENGSRDRFTWSGADLDLGRVVGEIASLGAAFGTWGLRSPGRSGRITRMICQRCWIPG